MISLSNVWAGFPRKLEFKTFFYLFVPFVVVWRFEGSGL